MIYDVVGLVDKKYISDPLDTDKFYDQSYDIEGDEEILDDDYEDDYEELCPTENKSNIIDVFKEKLIKFLAISIQKTELITLIGDDEEEIIEWLSQYSLEDLFYMRKGLREYELMDSVNEKDFNNFFSIDIKGQLNLF